MSISSFDMHISNVLNKKKDVPENMPNISYLTGISKFLREIKISTLYLVKKLKEIFPIQNLFKVHNLLGNTRNNNKITH